MLDATISPNPISKKNKISKNKNLFLVFIKVTDAIFLCFLMATELWSGDLLLCALNWCSFKPILVSVQVSEDADIEISEDEMRPKNSHRGITVYGI